MPMFNQSLGIDTYLGEFATAAALQAAYPAASNVGKTAMVGSAAPYTQYVSSGSAWAQSPVSGAWNRLPRWKSALAARAAGTRNAKLLVISDSTGVGGYATGVNWPGNKAFSWPAKLAEIFTSAGIAANDDCVFGECTNTNVATAVACDPRISVGAGWGIGATFRSVGGNVFANNNNGDVSVYSFTPRKVFDTIKVTYAQASGYGKFSVSLNGGAPLGAAINCNGAGSFQTVTIACPRGLSRVDISRSAPTGADGNLAILAIQTEDSSNRSINICNASVGGQTTSNALVGGAWYDPLQAGQYFAPDLTIICMDVNDWITGVSGGLYDTVTTTTHFAQIQRLVDAYKSVGDVLLLTGVPSKTTAYSVAVQEAILKGTRQVALSSGVPLLDVNANWGTWQAAQDAGFWAPAQDAVHPGAAGYADIAAQIAAYPGLNR